MLIYYNKTLTTYRKQNTQQHTDTAASVLILVGLFHPDLKDKIAQVRAYRLLRGRIQVSVSQSAKSVQKTAALSNFMTNFPRWLWGFNDNK